MPAKDLLAKSRAIVSRLPAPLCISVVFAVYGEQHRILRPEEHELGEDFLRVKLDQLGSLFATRPDLGWDLTIVDDGCPDGSGRIAQQILDEHPLGDHGRVLHLQDAIDAGHPTARALHTTSDSRKGGSIQYGMYEAVHGGGENQIVVFTDADLSTDLGQVGLLAEGILSGADAAIGSRREPESVVVKTGVRNTRGKLFIYVWKQLVTVLDDIVDTQCGFKAFRGEVVRDLVSGTKEKGFAFDVELLLRTQLKRRGSITKLPIAWIDSEAASTLTAMTPYLGMLKAIADMYRRYLPANERADAFARFLDDLDEDGWNQLLANLPAEIAEGDPTTFTATDPTTAKDLRRAAGLPE
jgi:glycosyltransferase involved in cell wall biosynthesis